MAAIAGFVIVLIINPVHYLLEMASEAVDLLCKDLDFFKDTKGALPVAISSM